MNDLINIQIVGVITNTTEIHVSAFGGKSNPVPTMKKSIAAPVVIQATNEREGFVAPLQIPYIPGNSVRGRLRRVSAARIERTLVERGETLTRGAYYLLNNGSTSTQSAKGNYSVPRYQAVRDDLFLNLFGAETDYSSKLVTPDIIPVIEETLELGLVPQTYRQHITPLKARSLLQVFTLTKKDDFMSMRDPMAPQVVEDYVNVFNERQDEVMSNVQARKAEKNTGADSGDERTRKTDFENILGFEAIIPGVSLYFRVSARGVTKAQAGLLIRAVEDLHSEKPLGGNVRYGLGRWNGQLDLIIDGERHANAMRFNAEEGNQFNPLATDLLLAADHALESYTRDTLMQFATESEAATEKSLAVNAKKIKAIKEIKTQKDQAAGAA